MKKAKVKCSWCHGHGIYRSFKKYGWRRTMEAGPNGKPLHTNEPVDPCEYCGKPEVVSGK